MHNDLSLWVKKIFLALLIWAVLSILYTLSSLVLVIVIAGFITILLNPLIERWEKHKIPAWITLLCVYILVFFLGGIVIGTLIPIIIDYVSNTIAIVTLWVNNAQSIYLKEGLSGFHFHPYIERLIRLIFGENNIEHTLDIIKQNAGNIQSIITTQVSSLTTGGISIVSAVGWVVANWAFIGVMTFLMVLERRSVGRFLLGIVPVRFEKYMHNHYHSVQTVCNSWIRGTLILSLSIFFVTYIGLYSMEYFLNTGFIQDSFSLAPFTIENKFSLALIGGIMEFIPYVWPLIALIPAAIIWLWISWEVALSIVFLYLFIQRIENDFLVPYVMSKALDISPLLVFIVMIAGASLGGILGIILAVPLAGMAKVIYSEYQDKKAPTKKVRETSSGTPKNTKTIAKAKLP